MFYKHILFWTPSLSKPVLCTLCPPPLYRIQTREFTMLDTRVITYGTLCPIICLFIWNLSFFSACNKNLLINKKHVDCLSILTMFPIEIVGSLKKRNKCKWVMIYFPCSILCSLSGTICFSTTREFKICSFLSTVIPTAWFYMPWQVWDLVVLHGQVLRCQDTVYRQDQEKIGRVSIIHLMEENNKETSTEKTGVLCFVPMYSDWLKNSCWGGL